MILLAISLRPWRSVSAWVIQVFKLNRDHIALSPSSIWGKHSSRIIWALVYQRKVPRHLDVLIVYYRPLPLV